MKRPGSTRWAVLGLGVLLGSCTAPGRPALAPSPARAPALTLLPMPERVEVRPGAFVITAATPIVVHADDAAAGRVAEDLAGFIARASGVHPAIGHQSSGHAPAIEFVYAEDSILGDEGYQLTVSPASIRVVADKAAGLFYGVQTLRQLLPYWDEYAAIPFGEPRPVSIAGVEITDRPRYPWRGAMLDVARHFFGVADVERYIDVLALLKMNRLHLHLADDQGWRLEIAKWPDLTAIGGATEVGGGRGGFFTKAQYAELVAYAAARFIVIVPEIDMPGHINAAMASYGSLNCDGTPRPPYTSTGTGVSVMCVGAPLTYQFIDDVIGEIAAMTPGPYIHIGGDEVRSLPAEQYRAFIERVQEIVTRHGKTMIGWDEIAGISLRPTSIVQHWRPDAARSQLARAPHLILSPGSHAYLDMKYNRTTALGLSWAGLVPVRTAYDWDPALVVPGAPGGAVLGVEAPLWSETIATIHDVEFLAMPRLAGMAELAWAPAASHNWKAFARRLGAQAPRWTALGLNFYRAPEVRWRTIGD